MMNMICKKCEGRINTGVKCFSCGYDNANPFTDLNAAKKYKRSPVLIGIMSLFIILALVTIISRIGVFAGNPALASFTVIFSILTGVSNSIFFVYIPGVHYMALAVLTIAVAVAEIALCVSILKLEKRALKIYSGLLIGVTALRLIASINMIMWPVALFRMLMPYLLKILLLFLVYKTDGRHFGSSALIDEPVSVKLMRRRLERAGK